MAVCEVCGNDYDMSFEVRAQGVTHIFDSLQCAIQAIAPICEHCGARVIGHGVAVDHHWYCCAHCAREEGATTIVDREMSESVPSQMAW